MRKFRLVFILLCSFYWVKSQQPQYVFNRISNKEGLVSNYVYTILQDKRGFWWFGTANGLQRYDGKKIIMFKAGADLEGYLPSQAISQIFEDSSGRFWVRCGSEVGLFDPATFRYKRAKVMVEGDVPPRAEYSLWQSPPGEIFLLIRNKGFYTYDASNNSFHAKKNPFSLPANWNPTAFAKDPRNSSYWIVTDSGLAIYDPLKKKLYSRLYNPDKIALLDNLALTGTTTTFYIDRKLRAWIVSWPARHPRETFYCYDLVSNRLLPDTAGMTSPISRYHELQAFYEQKNGTLWSYGRMLLMQYDPVQRRHYYLRNEHTDDYGIKYDELLCIYEDREGNIWLGTDQGVYVFNPSAQPFHPVNLIRRSEEENADRTVTSFLETTDKEIWAGTWGMGIISFDQNLQLLGNRLTAAAGRRDDNFSRVWSMCQQKQSGLIWAGCQSGRLITYDPIQKTTRYLTVPLIEEKTIRQIVEDKNGNVWLATQYGHLLKWTAGSASFESGFRLMQNIGTIVYRMTVDRQGFVWLATHLKGVYKIDPATGQILMHYRAGKEKGRSLYSDFASDLAQYDDSLMIVASGALNVINMKTGSIRHITSMDGLPANNVNSIAIDDQQTIWLGMLGSLTRYNFRKDIFTNFSQRDGVLNSNFQAGATAFVSGKRMLFGTFRDFVSFRPMDVRASSVPPDVNITDFKLFNSYLPPDSIISLDKVRLKPNQNSIAIEFAALSFLQKDKIIYYYKLEGIDNDWRRVENLLMANYTLLPAGDYTFKVFCENSEGIASKHVTSLKIHIDPPFWQSWWFILLIGLAAAGLIYLAHRIRVNRILDMEKVRSRIARDLHDDMGSTLSTINILSEMAKMKVSQDSNKTSEYLNKISDNSSRMMEAMDDIVWSINPMNDNMVRITARMREFATGVLEAKDIDFTFRVDDAVLFIKLDMEQRRDFFLLFKEAVNNLAKYSECRHANIDISVRGHILMMNIEDDGIGFDVNNADSGNGLTNMKKRAGNIGGDLRIISAPGRGTSVKFSLKLH